MSKSKGNGVDPMDVARFSRSRCNKMAFLYMFGTMAYQQD